MTKIYEFHWQAQSRFGQKQRGKRLATNRDMLENLLLAQGYQHIRISRNFVLSANPKKEEVNSLLSQLALLVNSAMPLKQALSMLLQNCRNIRLYLWLNELIQHIERGYAFSQSLEKLGEFVTNQEIQLIKMGEQSGKLGIMLTNLAESRAKLEKLAKKVKKILFYPVIVLLISLALSIGLLVLIVPQFAQLYGSKDKTLPLITDILFTLSECLIEQGTVLLGTLLLAVIFYLFFAKKSRLVAKWKMALWAKMPLFSRIIEQSRIIFFSQNIALMLNAHIPLDVALRSFLSEKNDDPILQQEIGTMLNLLQQGYKFSQGINPNVFGAEMAQMLEVGEKSGNVAKMCEHISEMYQQKLDYQIDILSQLLEPMLMLIMGVIVGTIIVGLYLPIFDMGALVE
ncbi:type II secretion system F family protein [Mannheimia haemolytica]|uniref:type II secretion system F family protein n=1 Tax=Mannheimia haemolytica TaxID=75985 RepID=UPI0003183584|nr:type II secretion system F family protein [Mannheimia haemolytica]HDL6201880.1 type II secretion system F family protein [Mannheimia haemolytica]HDZ6745433.1 type II secretion system F family protein [Mannheimia haemolytica]HDZ6811652.1 type II secretion system F family protein [Mannheimia haemolytica]